MRHAGYRPVRGLRKLYTNGPTVASLLLKRQVDVFIARDGGWAKESWHCVAVSFSWMKKEGGSSSSVPGFMYSVYHVTLIHPIEPSIYIRYSFVQCIGTLYIYRIASMLYGILSSLPLAGLCWSVSAWTH